MAHRTPIADGLAFAPNAPGFGTNPPASPEELRQHRFWGRFSGPTFLPNAGGNPAGDPAYSLLRPGDVSWSQSDGLLYALRDRGTLGGSDAVWVAIPAGPLSSAETLVWGQDSVASGLQVRYLTPGWEAGTAPTFPRQFESVRAGVATAIRAHHQNPGGTGAVLTYTLRVNGVASALSVGLATTATTAVAAAAVPIAVGDLLDIQVTRVVAAGSGARRPGISVRLG